MLDCAAAGVGFGAGLVAVVWIALKALFYWLDRQDKQLTELVLQDKEAKRYEG